MRYIILGAVSLIGFVALAQAAQTHKDILETVVLRAGAIGVATYMGLLVLAIVVAPISTGFLLPVAANSWGPLEAAIYSIAGWTLGAVIAFWLSRRYGLRWIGHFSFVRQLRAVEEAIPRRHKFIAVLLLRAAFPVEILSYALGVFSTIRFLPYLIATVVGITPFTVLVSYASVGSIQLQVVAGVASAASFVAGAAYVAHRGVIAKATLSTKSDTLSS